MEEMGWLINVVNYIGHQVGDARRLGHTTAKTAKRDLMCIP